MNNSLDYISLTTTIAELTKIGETVLADKLIDIMTHNELEKPEKHDRKNDKTTSYFRINISKDEKEKIIDLFLNLEIGYLTADGETTAAASHYSDLVVRWSGVEATE